MAFSNLLLAIFINCYNSKVLLVVKNSSSEFNL